MSSMRKRTATLTTTECNEIHDRWKCKSAEEKLEEAIRMIKNASISKPQAIFSPVSKEPSYLYKCVGSLPTMHWYDCFDEYLIILKPSKVKRASKTPAALL